MSDIEFDSDQVSTSIRSNTSSAPSMNNMTAASLAYANSSNNPKLISWLMKKGIVKSAKTGNIFLFGVIIFNIVVTVALIMFIL